MATTLPSWTRLSLTSSTPASKSTRAVLVAGLLLLGLVILSSGGGSLHRAAVGSSSWRSDGSTQGGRGDVDGSEGVGVGVGEGEGAGDCEGVGCPEGVPVARDPQDVAAKQESDAYFSSGEPEDDSDMVQEDDLSASGGKASSSSSSTSQRNQQPSYEPDSTSSPLLGRKPFNLTWPGRNEDYVALSKGTVSRTIFNDHGKTLMKTRVSMDDYPTFKPKSPLTSGVHIITTFFHGSYTAERMSEVVATLAANLENPYVSYVHTLWEKENPAMYFVGENAHLLKKLVAVEVKKQPTYSVLFRYANQALGRGSVAIITNADIYFTSSLRCLAGPDETVANKTTPRMYALSRRHTQLCGLLRPDYGRTVDLCESYIHSHDAFVFAPPVPERLIARVNHPQNRLGGENAVIFEAVGAGYQVLNPCKRLHAVHLHCTAERHYATYFIDGSNGSGGPKRHGTVWPGTIRVGQNRRDWRRGGIVPCGARIW